MRAGFFAGTIALLFWGGATPALGENRWVRARLGSFEAISDDGRNSAVQALSQFEQFRFALGSAMGQTELRLDPPLRIVVFRNEKELAASGCTGLVQGRERLTTCATAEGQLPASLLRILTRKLLQENFAALPAPMESALVSFFSTVRSNAVHVTWGAPPPPAERTREWAFLARIVTQPDTAGRAHIYLHNLARGMEQPAAIRSMGEDPAKLNAEVDRFLAAGAFTPTQAPNRPLNPDRDFNTTVLTSDEGELARADLLGKDAEARYEALLKVGKQVIPANEGLALLAIRAGDPAKARPYIDAARSAGTRNTSALTAFAQVEQDDRRAETILKEVLSIDPKYALAHWTLGERFASEPRRRMGEWKQAIDLEPRNYQWAEKYASLCEAEKYYAEAGRAWVVASQGAPDLAKRDEYLARRARIESLRIEDEDAIRRAEAAEKAAELERLKAEAREEVRRLEARTNKGPLDPNAVVDWWDEPGEKMTGTLVKIDCLGREFRLELKDEKGITQRLLIRDPHKIAVSGGEMTFACGPQKPRALLIGYKPAKDAAKGTVGEVTAIDLR
jgi:Tfp pilus assembly protein PilF